MTFNSDTSIRCRGNGAFDVDLQPNWLSLVGIHGGYVTAIAARGIEEVVDDESRPLRSLSTQFVRSPAPGAATLDVHVHHHGRSISFVTARMVQADRLLLLASAICGQGRGGPTYSDLEVGRPPTPPPDQPQFVPSGVAVGHFVNADIFMDPDVVPFGAGDRSWVAGWLRPVGGEPVTLSWLACAADFFPPAVFSRTTGPVKAASIDYSLQFVTADPCRHVPHGGYVYAEMYSAVSAGGYAVEDGTLWAPDGKVLATSRQLRLAGE